MTWTLKLLLYYYYLSIVKADLTHCKKNVQFVVLKILKLDKEFNLDFKSEHDKQ